MSASAPPSPALAPSSAVAGETARPGLRRNLGTASIVFIVVAAASPLGVIGGPVPLGIAGGNGTGFPFAFVLATAVLLLFAVGFTQMTGHVRTAGAFYSYVARGLGQGPGLGAAFVAVLAYLALAAGVYGLIGSGVTALIAAYGGPEVPWWLGAAAAFALTGVLGFRNIAVSGKVLAVLLLAEVAIVLVFDAVVLFSGGGPEGYSTGIVTPAEIVSGAPGVGILFAILSFVGFEATAVSRDEARDPERTIPRSTYLSLVGIGVFYAVSAWVLIGAIGDSRAVEAAAAAPGTLLQDTTVVYLGAMAGHVVQLLFVTSLFACILSFHNIATRYLFQLGGRGVLGVRAGARLGAVHPTHLAPSVASLAVSGVTGALVLGAALAGLDPVAELYTWLGGISSVGVVLLLVATSVAVLVFFTRTERGGSAWKRRIAPALGLVGLLGFLGVILANLPSLVGEGGYGPLSVGVLVLLLGAFAAGPVVARRHGRLALD